MTEVVINACFGGFGLSHDAVMALAARKGIKLYVETAPNGLVPYHYFTVPPERYHALQAEIEKSNGDYKQLNEMNWYFSEREIARDDPDLVAVVRELGAKANSRFADLRVVEVPDDVEWEIAEYDGSEHVAEKHRTWS
jgi:hypothetical protein